MAFVTAIERTREDGIRSIDKLIEARLKHVNCACDVTLSLAKYKMTVGDEKEKEREKEEEGEQLEQQYVCSLMLLNWLTLIRSPPAPLMSPPLHQRKIASLLRCPSSS